MNTVLNNSICMPLKNVKCQKSCAKTCSSIGMGGAGQAMGERMGLRHAWSCGGVAGPNRSTFLGVDLFVREDLLCSVMHSAPL